MANDDNNNLSMARKAVIFIVGGATQMSFFITFFTVDYFNYFFQTYQPEFWLSLFVSLLSFIGALITIIRPFQVTFRLPMVSFFISSAIFSVCVPLFVYLAHANYITFFQAFVIDITALSLLGFFESLNSGCVFGFLGKYYGEKGVQLAQSGTTWVALSLYVLRVILKGAIGETTQDFLLSGYLEFGCVATWMIVCASLSFYVTSQSEHDKHLGSINNTEDEDNERQHLLDNDNKTDAFKSKEPEAPLPDRLRAMFSLVWKIILSMTLGLIFNQMFYPGVFSVLQGTSSSWPVLITFGCFAIFDTIGQTLPAYFAIYTKRTFFLFPISQLFLTVLMGLAIQDSFAGNVFKSDYYISVLAAIWGFNVGSGVCCHMMLIVQSVSKEQKGIASTAAVVTLQMGLILAAACGLGIKAAIQDSI